MHLLAAKPGMVADGSEAVDLGQSPADIVILTAADTEIACFAHAHATLRSELGARAPSLRLANLMQLSHNLSVDLYVDQVAAHARLIIVRLLGGRGYWPYGVERLTETARARNLLLAWLPGDDQPDAELAGLSTVEPGAAHQLWQYAVHGGAANAEQALRFAFGLLDCGVGWREPAPLLSAGLYWPGHAEPGLADIQAAWVEGRPVAAIAFYRALLQAGNLTAIDGLIDALREAGLNALPLYANSLKDPVAAEIVARLLDQANANIVLNCTGFALSNPTADPEAGRRSTPFDGVDGPILQVVFSGGDEAAWREGSHGLSARDIAMNVALPEVDGRLLTRAVSFKGAARRDPATEADIVTYQPVGDRLAFTARLAAAWVRLQQTPRAERRIALVLANYPNRDGRIGNGVGLDTPASALAVLSALARAGYTCSDVPEDGNDLVDRLAAGPTNAGTEGRVIRETIDGAEYRAFLATLAPEVRDAVTERWGAPEADPFFMAERDAFALPVLMLGQVALCLQPARGYNIDPVASYHDPALVPPHNYLALHAWLRGRFDAHAVVHLGKHGNLEWLPGKALALSQACYPEAALGPMPNLYPFIVNDPGEGTQAKRRTSACIVDHLTPPLTRAESYGPLRDLELLIDEYFEAAGLDPRRLKVLARDILELAGSAGLDADCAISARDDTDDALAKLDAYLCELKEMQIRDGLHVLGHSPRDGADGTLETDLLVALARVPRGDGDGRNASILRALAADLQLGGGFDPLDCDMAAAWTGPRPDALAKLGEDRWRSAGDTVERLEGLAHALVSGATDGPSDWHRTHAVLDAVGAQLRPAVRDSGPAEIDALLRGLDGRFVAPGPSGAPTRGRPDVLPTGRNFFSVDTRVVPTPAAWKLGWKSASLMITRHVQECGDYPRSIALSAWGTSNMRTGGDDIAQALALMGVRPTWDAASRRVTGFEVLPLDVLDRPRVDVTLRVSGFFRDAFANLIDLVDSAARAVAALDEPAAMNPLAAAVARERDALVAGGADAETAERHAGHRVFGSQPGAYGAGLQALIDERGWDSDADLARAYLAWSGFAYGAGAGGEPAHALFERRLAAVDAIAHNQDNREHDLLDSDDYYQFEGGLAAAVKTLSGSQPIIYHNDHSRPESPKVRRLEEEIARVVRARVVNPKWIRGVMRHGYKGAFEIAATVDYLFAFAATTGLVADHHFDAVHDAFVADETVRGFLAENNAAALAELEDRLAEAIDRGLWQPRRNSVRAELGAPLSPRSAPIP